MLYLVKVTGWRLLICRVKKPVPEYNAHCPHEDCSYELKQKLLSCKASTPSESGSQQHLPDGIGLVGQEQIYVAVSYCKRCLLLCIDKV